MADDLRTEVEQVKSQTDIKQALKQKIVRYLVHPKEAGRLKTRLIRKLLGELNAAPDRVLFPKGNADKNCLMM